MTTVLNGQPVCLSCYVTDVIAKAAAREGAPAEVSDIEIVGAIEADEHTPGVILIYVKAIAPGLHFQAQVPHEYVSPETIVAATLAAYRETIAFCEGRDDDEDADLGDDDAPREVFVH